MDIKKLAATFLLLIAAQNFRVVHSTLPNPKPQPDAAAAPTSSHPEKQRDNGSGSSSGEKRMVPLPRVNFAAFPERLDIRTLRNMPMVILHPSKPINLGHLQNMNVKNKQEAFSSLMKILGTVSQADMAQSKPAAKVNEFRDKDQGNRHSNNKKHATVLKEEGEKDEKGTQDNEAAFSESSSTVIPHSARGFGDQAGWLEKFRGTFSNMFPHRNPFIPRPIPFGFSNPRHLLPAMPPKFPNNFHPNMNPFAASNNNPVLAPFPGPFGGLRIPPHHVIPLHPGQMFNLDLSPEGSHQFPLILPLHPSGIRPGIPFGGRRPLPFPHIMDQMTSASESLPHHVLPPKGFGTSRFVIPPYPGSSSLSKKDTPITGPSRQISNAFADFAASEKDPTVVEGFGSVGGSINKFLNMMGLGVSGITQGFGDISGLDASGRGIESRSLDFFPGYGNQAMLDEMDDMDVFQEDITEQYMRTLPKTTTTKATQKPSTKPPKPSTTAPSKKQTESKPMSSTKPTAPPSSPSKAPKAAAEKQQIMHPKNNGSMMAKMPQHEKMRIEDAKKVEEGKDSKKDVPGDYTDSRGMGEKSKMTMPASMKNHDEPNKMHPLPLQPQHDSKQSPNKQKSSQMSHDPSKVYQKAHPIRTPVSAHEAKRPDNKQTYVFTWNNSEQIDGNKHSPSLIFGKPMIFSYSNGELKSLGELKVFDKVVESQPTPNSQVPKSQDHPSEMEKTQKDSQSNDNTSKDTEKKSTMPKPSGEKSYASAHSMPDSESPPLLNTYDVRPWVPVSTGRGYVERRPVTSHDIKSQRKEQVKEIIQMSFRKQQENSESKKQN